MSSGPCLCGDPYCSRCGDPTLAAIEAAEESAMKKLADANLTADEYETAVTVGLAAVQMQRIAIKAELAAYRTEQALAKSEEDLGVF